MITLRRANERHHVRRRKQETWRTFYPQDRSGPLAEGFGALAILNEDLLPPGAGGPFRPHHDAEIITYVLQGALVQEDAMGRSGVIQAGEFQRLTAGRGVRQCEANASVTDWAHVFQICLHPSQVGLDPSHEQKRFWVAERRGVLCVIASPDARRGSLRIHQDTLLYSAMLDPGQHLVHELTPHRIAWLHVVRGEVTLGDVVLTTGDGAGVTAERAISLTARKDTEILLLDLGEQQPRSPHLWTFPTNGPLFARPDAERSRLRAIVATIDREISHLPRQATADDGGISMDALLASWAALVDLLALGPEPDVRECPACRHIGMRAASRCGYCWTELSPPNKRDGVPA